MRKLLVCLPLVLVACGGGGSGGATSHAVAACHAADDAAAAWHRYQDASSKELTGGDLIRPASDPAQTKAKNEAASDITAADERMTSESAKAAASDPKWDTLNRAMNSIARQNRDGGAVDASVNSTVNAECAKASAS